tara:strand:- start:990 stop:1904 length:915 start_codon:yes stop_codon:yes gene_type:complete
MTNTQKPFIKWVGGKAKLLQYIIPKFPKNIKNYHEIFLGGGSVLFALLSMQKNNDLHIENNIYAYDINLPLINTYKQIKNNLPKVIKILNKLKKEFTSIETNTYGIKRWTPNVNNENYKETREHYYYYICSKFNKCLKNSVVCAAYFIFLNKTGFRGMYRENNQGLYNIPYGLKDTNKIPSIYDENELNKISQLIQHVKFRCMSFDDSLKKVKEGDFVYLDPPYAPENKTSFVKYNKDGFPEESHNLLFKTVKELENVKFIMSNANVELVTSAFETYNIQHIIARRAINSKDPSSTAKEVVIHN